MPQTKLALSHSMTTMMMMMMLMRSRWRTVQWPEYSNGYIRIDANLAGMPI